MMYRYVVAAVVSMAASFVFAQVEVEDRRITSSKSGAVQPQPAQNNSAEMYYQMQVLQQEVLQLRGMVEQQAFEIKKLKQQRLDDYLDLDRRLSQLGKSSTRSDAANIQTSSSATSQIGSAPADELKSYKSAINLVLKEQKYDEAITALNKHLESYPRGRYSANALYWLGEIYLLKNELESARSWFSSLIQDYPDHTKVPDAQFKLGKVYDLLGDKQTAKNLLQKVAQSNTNAARLARDYLDTNFPQ